jgi:hypothetical protein
MLEAARLPNLPSGPKKIAAHSERARGFDLTTEEKMTVVP